MTYESYATKKSTQCMTELLSCVFSVLCFPQPTVWIIQLNKCKPVFVTHIHAQICEVEILSIGMFFADIVQNWRWKRVGKLAGLKWYRRRQTSMKIAIVIPNGSDRSLVSAAKINQKEKFWNCLSKEKEKVVRVGRRYLLIRKCWKK